jgi:hypothetical protein
VPVVPRVNNTSLTDGINGLSASTCPSEKINKKATAEPSKLANISARVALVAQRKIAKPLAAVELFESVFIFVPILND